MPAQMLGAAMIPCMILVLGAVLYKGPGQADVSVRTIAVVCTARLILLPLLGEHRCPRCCAALLYLQGQAAGHTQGPQQRKALSRDQHCCLFSASCQDIASVQIGDGDWCLCVLAACSGTAVVLGVQWVGLFTPPNSLFTLVLLLGVSTPTAINVQVAPSCM